MEVLAKFLLIILVFWLLGYVLFKYIFPWLLKRYIKKLAKKMNPDFEEKPKHKEGEIRIDYVPENETDDNNDAGEYIDYEELK